MEAKGIGFPCRSGLLVRLVDAMDDNEASLDSPKQPLHQSESFDLKQILSLGQVSFLPL